MSSRMLEGTSDRQSSLAPGRAARKWMSVTSSGRRADAEQIAARLRINPEFAGQGLRHARAGHDRHHHRPTGRAGAPQCTDPRELNFAIASCDPGRTATFLLARARFRLLTDGRRSIAATQSRQ